MGSVQHHQTQARRFLSLARSDHNAGDHARAADALARAASHAATAAVVERNWFSRYTRRRLTNYLFLLAAEGRISNGGVRTFRHIYDLSRRLAEADPREARRLCRQARNRVAMLIRSIEGAISGRPVTGRGRRPVPPPAPSCAPIHSGDHRPARLPGDRRCSRSGRRAPGATPRPPRLLPPGPDASALRMPPRKPGPAPRAFRHRNIPSLEARPGAHLPRQTPRHHPRPGHGLTSLSLRAQRGNLATAMLSLRAQRGNLAAAMLSLRAQRGNLATAMLSSRAQRSNPAAAMLSSPAQRGNLAATMLSLRAQRGNPATAMLSSPAQRGNLVAGGAMMPVTRSPSPNGSNPGNPQISKILLLTFPADQSRPVHPVHPVHRCKITPVAV